MEKLPIDEIIMQLDSKEIKERNAAIQIVRFHLNDIMMVVV